MTLVSTGSNIGVGLPELEDKFVKVSVNDTTANYLFSKLESTGGTVTFSINNSGGDEKVNLEATSAGEDNTASNIGAGTGVFFQKSGVDLEFKSITVQGGLVITSTASEIDIDASGVGGADGNGIYDGSGSLSASTDVDLNSLSLTFSEDTNSEVEMLRLYNKNTTGGATRLTLQSDSATFGAGRIYANKSGTDIGYMQISPQTSGQNNSEYSLVLKTNAGSLSRRFQVLEDGQSMFSTEPTAFNTAWNSVLASRGDGTVDFFKAGTASTNYLEVDASGQVKVRGADDTSAVGFEYLNASGSPVLVGTNNQRVGIGTSSPGATLDVRGSAIFNEDGGNNDFRIEGLTEANLFFVDASADRIGIGTSTLSAPLQVQGTGNAAININVSGDSSDRFKIFLGDGTGGFTGSHAYYTTSGSADHHFQANGVETLTISSNDVGVNNTAITGGSAKLLVGSSSTPTTTTIVGSGKEAVLKLTSHAAATDTGITMGVNGAFSRGKIYLNGTSEHLFLEATNSEIVFRTGAAGTTERMRIEQAGNVGVGQTNPTRKLHVYETNGDPSIKSEGLVDISGGGVADSYSGGLNLDPAYDGANTVTRHNYIDVNNPTLTTSAVVTDAAVMRFDAAAGTHKAVDSGTTKTTPGTVDAWAKININGTIYYIPAYTSKTT